MTGSGKTHSIFGNHPSEYPNPASLEKGISHQSLDFIFKVMGGHCSDTKNCSFKFSYLEIYNENVRDLLSEMQKTLNIIEDPVKGV